jgi:Zn-dependent peptidase ImmA (M78 family)
LTSRRARQAARRIYEQDRYDFPANVDEIARAHGLTVSELELDDTVSGVLVINEVQAVIGVNESHHKNRKRFTVAHELGHYLLHRSAASLFIDTAYVFFRDEKSSDGTRRQEVEANAFASELLMPEKAVREHAGNVATGEFDKATMDSLAHTFGVSVQALTFRLAKLGLISDGDF